MLNKTLLIAGLGVTLLTIGIGSKVLAQESSVIPEVTQVPTEVPIVATDMPTSTSIPTRPIILPTKVFPTVLPTAVPTGKVESQCMPNGERGVKCTVAPAQETQNINNEKTIEVHAEPCTGTHCVQVGN
jgi:hypothetical protein